MPILNELNCLVTDVKPTGATRELVAIPNNEYEVLAHKFLGAYYISISVAETLINDPRIRKTSFGRMLEKQLVRQPASAAILEERVPPSEENSAGSSGIASTSDDVGIESGADYKSESPPTVQVKQAANMN